jgi:uncharacterized protein (TIGR04551 family)
LKLCVLLLALAACPTFHAGPLPGAPASATFVDVDGVHVHYRELGTGPAVVLIHGFGASLDSWGTVAPVVAAHHRVIAVDLKGFGWTSRPEGDYSPEAQARLVWAVLDKLGVTDVAIVGHSWGSSVALAMAVQHPDRTHRVALYDAYVYDDQVPSFFRWAEKGAFGDLLFGLFYRERIEERAALAYADEGYITQARVDHVEAELARPGTVAAALATVRGHHFAALHAALASFDRPVLLLWGADDQVTPLRFGQRLANELANVELKVYPQCGHIPMVEAFRPSTRDLLKFLDDGASSEDAGTTPVALPPPALAEARGPKPEALLPLSDLAQIGSELTPRLYAAPRDRIAVAVHGLLRMRDAHLYNLDLDRGLDAMGRPVFPVPLGGGQSLDSADLRARTDIAIYAPGVGVSVKSRIDWLDNVSLGGTPDLAGGSPATSTGQRPTAVVVKRAWAEALLPVGTIAVGRLGVHFGLGMVVNNGDCEDCDHGDSADALAFVTPVAGHLVGVAYDIASRGPFTPSRDGGHAIALEPSDRAAGATLAIFKVHVPAALARRAAAGLTSLEYAGYLSHRTQDRDVPAAYLPGGSTMFTSNDLIARGFSSTTASGWLRITSARFRIEAEVAYARANVAQPSLIPGAALTDPITSSQLGAALQSSLTAGGLQLGVDGGYASGDSAPGFGAFPKAGDAPTMPGAFDGPQAAAPRDRTVDNFRFHPDYHVDQILFREIIGTVTDAIYVRPHGKIAVLAAGNGRLELGAALLAAWAVEATSTPSGARALGIELDPELRYASRDGFAATIDYGLLLPGAAWDNTNLSAKPAQVVRARLGFAF